MSRDASTTKEDRLSIRANPQQKAALAQAAWARHMNVSQFVLQVSLREADRIIREESALSVSPEEYAWLARLMDEASAVPRLKEALAQKSVWDA